MEPGGGTASSMGPAAGEAAALEIRGGTVLPMDGRRVVDGSVWSRGGVIVAVGGEAPAGWPAAEAEVLDARGALVIPGLVQAHTHACQTLARGGADDLPLLAWLRLRIWPHEAALDERAMRAAARLAAAELIRGGTTAVLDMGTVRETDALCDELGRSGLRAVVGASLMDEGEGVPARMRQTTGEAIDESDGLRRRWAGSFDGRLGWAYAPRFVLGCSEALLREVAARLREGARVHTHAAEQLAEVALVRSRRGDDNVSYLHRLGLGGPKVTLAHCVHLTDLEQRLLASAGTHVAHCPSSNLKLASGVAPIPELLAAGVRVALGADGAACNNNLDAFQEMRLAALIHKPRAGASAMNAWTVLELATVGGARALGIEDRVGRLVPGLRADVTVVDAEAPHLSPGPAPASTLVYAARGSDVRHVVVDGRVLLRARQLTALTGLDADEVVARAREQARRVALRADALQA